MAALAVVALAVPAWAPAQADVKAGVDAWSRGDYAAAVAEWKAPAESGDADALFNMAQAYRLGRGVEEDSSMAEYYYARAAEKGHIRAADIYGLILFQTGRREQALSYVQDAARRGDPRSQYLLGIAHFNGDLVAKDWVRAYALLTMANTQGLPQAGPALAEMDQYVPFAQRQQAAALAVEMQQQAEATRASQLAAFDLSAADGSPALPSGSVVQPAAKPKSPTAPLASASPRVPQPVRQAAIPPSSAAAEAAVRQAMEADGTDSPATAGADYARPAAPAPKTAQSPIAPPPARPAPKPAAAQVAQPAVRPAPVPAAPKPAARPAQAVAATGPWKLQLGAFGVKGNAQKLWAQLSVRPELSGKQRILVPSGKVTKLLAGGFASRAEADRACVKLKAAGQECLVTQ
ncbi:SPOR domain-containing protein [Altererythrobacter sp. CC-YST694]|nr:SPOR domain-containing protein [Altererythrobacter sp. CC-YST694]